MRAILEGNAREIADFVLAAQGQRMPPIDFNPITPKTSEEKKVLADSIQSAIEDQQKNRVWAR